MQVEVEDRLSCDSAIVGEQVVTLEAEFLHQSLGDVFRPPEDRCVMAFWQFEEIPAMATGDDQRMAMVDGIDIKDPDDLIVRIEHFGRDRSIDDPAEYAVVHRRRKIYRFFNGKSKLFRVDFSSKNA